MMPDQIPREAAGTDLLQSVRSDALPFEKPTVGLGASPTSGGDTQVASRLRGIDWRLISATAGLALIILAGLVLYPLLGEVTWRDVAASIARTPASDLALAALATALSYAALIGYDVLALRQVEARQAAWADRIGRAVGQEALRAALEGLGRARRRIEEDAAE